MTMPVRVNETLRDLPDRASIADAAALFKPNADLFILNGFPAEKHHQLKESDHLILIKKGEIPASEELEYLMAARHTPGIHARLKRASIGIAGCGGLGSTLAVSLARVGIGRLVIADFDIVEPSNLNRQQYFTDQIGLPKVEALQQNLKRINPGVIVEAHLVRLVPENIAAIFQNVEILIEAFDRADQKAMLVESAEKAFPGRPIILGLGMGGYGFNHLLHTRSVGNLHICGDEITEAGPNIGLMAPRVSITANLQANLALEILLGPDARLKQKLEEKPV